ACVTFFRGDLAPSRRRPPLRVGGLLRVRSQNKHGPHPGSALTGPARLGRPDDRLRARLEGWPVCRSYSAGFGAAAAAAFAAASAAALRSTKRTDQIEPSNKSISGTASESWLITSGGVSTAAMTNAPTMK